MRIKAAIVKEPDGAFLIEELELDKPQPGELLVRLEAVGICATDAAARAQHVPTPLPAVLGHEGAGIVEAIGAGVSGFALGDRICLTFSSCGSCEFCLDAKPWRCEQSGRLNFGGACLDGSHRLHYGDSEVSAFFGQGSFATHAVVNFLSAVRVGNDVPPEVAAPLGCGVQTGAGTILNVLKVTPGTSISVIGMGTVGMSAVMAARLAGARPIIAVGGNAKTLELAAELGATHAINRRETADIAAAIRMITDKGTHFTLDSSGNAALITAALHGLRPNGTLALVAPCEDLHLDVFSDLIDYTRRIVGVMEGASNPKLFIPLLLDYYKAGLLPLDRIITTYPFEDIEQAFVDSQEGNVIKAVLKM
ncbi:MAG: NAD(P)-dependent alcohol dehydrogenase [Coriobacteriales bacterium]|jgi:aryl-alcohol dehydrogenase|nr:NAD(P)-dependent alcohol dehydrogenase [Coriobacteriales bacterium]